MNWRPPVKRKPWFDTPLAREYSFGGMALVLIARRMAYVGHFPEDNDKDHAKW